MKTNILKLFIAILMTSIFLFLPLKSDAENFEACKDNCIVDDDEYCVYNQCYFDKQYRFLKTRLCLTDKQENELDIIYKNFKEDMEIVCEQYTKEKDILLEQIANDNYCKKGQIKKLKYIKQDIKEKYNNLYDDFKEQLCSAQKKKLKEFKKEQKSKIKKIVKYGAVYKFPCTNKISEDNNSNMQSN